MIIYGEITKIEAQSDGTIRVAGVASSGAIDDADEQVSPEAMKAALPAYMRFGALREMHGLTAAGATLSADVGEDGLTRIEAHVVDPVAVKKVQLGVYRGFSIGGRVLARDPTDPKVITKLKLNEISLVDRPCNPEAVIDMWKADLAGRPPSNAEVIAKAIELAAAAGKRGRHTEFVVKAREALLAAGGEASAVTAEPIAPALHPARTEKVGARNSQADLNLIQSAHDHMVALGASCGEAPEGDDGEKASALVGEDRLAKALAENERLVRAVEQSGPQIEALRRAVETLEARLEKVAAEPAAAKAMAGIVRAVSKADDVDPGRTPGGLLSADEFRKYLDGLPEDERGQLQLRAALRQPIAVGGR